MGSLRLGSVSSYEAERGLGLIAGPDGSEHLFHCTAIADGSRQIEVGEQVAFLLVAAHGGRYEASQVTKLT